jgi:HK97 family phage major capsid protein
MTTEIKELVSQFETINSELKSLRETHEAELKAASEGSVEAKAAAEALKGQLDDMSKKYDQAMADIVAQMKRPGVDGYASDMKTAGQAFVQSEVYAEIKASGRGSSNPVEVKSITGTSGSAGALVRPDRDPTVYRTVGGMRQLRIADLIPAVPTSSGSVEIMRLTTATGNAAPQQAGSQPSSAAGGGEFEAKKQSNLVYELVTVPVRTIAHFVPASRQVLSDAAQLQGIIDSELAYGLQLESDDQLLNGDGTGQNLTGILQDAAINDVGELANGTDPEDVPAAMIDHIRAAVTECQKNEYYNINGLVLNPADWQILETAKATDGHYLLMAFAPTAGESPTVWRVPVIVTNAMPEDTFLLGDWQLGATRYVREGVSIRVSESHADFFVRNGVAILGEERYCLGINRPKAFAKGSFEVASE